MDTAPSQQFETAFSQNHSPEVHTPIRTKRRFHTDIIVKTGEQLFYRPKFANSQKKDLYNESTQTPTLSREPSKDTFEFNYSQNYSGYSESLNNLPSQNMQKLFGTKKQEPYSSCTPKEKTLEAIFGNVQSPHSSRNAVDSLTNIKQKILKIAVRVDNSKNTDNGEATAELAEKQDRVTFVKRRKIKKVTFAGDIDLTNSNQRIQSRYVKSRSEELFQPISKQEKIDNKPKIDEIDPSLPSKIKFLSEKKVPHFTIDGSPKQNPLQAFDMKPKDGSPKPEFNKEFSSSLTPKRSDGEKVIFKLPSIGSPLSSRVPYPKVLDVTTFQTFTLGHPFEKDTRQLTGRNLKEAPSPMNSNRLASDRQHHEKGLFNYGGDRTPSKNQTPIFQGKPFMQLQHPPIIYTGGPQSYRSNLLMPVGGGNQNTRVSPVVALGPRNMERQYM